MKNLKNNKKGFTLIELLAVIVILAILVMVAVPQVTKYLNASRNSAFIDNARSAVSAVRNEYIITGGSGNAFYNKDQINELLEKKLIDSPFGGKYRDACVKVKNTNTGSDLTNASSVEYQVCLIDEKGNGFDLKDENNLEVGNVEDDYCTCSE